MSGYLRSPENHLLGEAKTLDDYVDNLPEAKPFNHSRRLIDCLDQGQTESCVSHALIVNMMMALRVMGMMERLSPWFLFSLLNNGQNIGANPKDAILALKEHGCCIDELVPRETLGPKGYNDVAMANAKRYTLNKYIKIRNFDEAVFVSSLGLGVCLPVQAGTGFGINGDGIIKYLGDDLNHYVFAGERYDVLKGVEVLKSRGSYGRQWGNDGWGWLTRQHFDVAYDMFAIVSVNIGE